MDVFKTQCVENSNSEVNENTKREENMVGPDTNIMNTRKLLQQFCSCLFSIKAKAVTLEDNMDNSDYPWDTVYEGALKLMSELQTLKTYLKNESFMFNATRKVRMRKKKRQRQAQYRKECRIQQEMDRKKQNETIDALQNCIIQKVAEEKQEKQLKKEADETLSEVNKKLSDIDRVHRLLAALELLRQLRKEAAFRKGLKPPVEADEEFASRIKEIYTIGSEQREIYEAEQKTLQVMLDIEQEETRERERQRKMQRDSQQLQVQRDAVCEKLFGFREENLYDATFNSQYYNQALNSFDGFLNVRSQWDAFLVQAPEGATVPPFFVSPVASANDTWNSALEGNL